MKVLKALKLKTKSNKKPRVCAMKHAVGAELLWRPSSLLKHKLKYAMLRLKEWQNKKPSICFVLLLGLIAGGFNT